MRICRLRLNRATLLAGGFPEARQRSAARRAAFFDSYLATVLERDLCTIAHVHDRANVRRLLEALAAITASPLNLDGLARDLGVAHGTVRDEGWAVDHKSGSTLLLICRPQRSSIGPRAGSARTSRVG